MNRSFEETRVIKGSRRSDPFSFNKCKLYTKDVRYPVRLITQTFDIRYPGRLVALTFDTLDILYPGRLIPLMIDLSKNISEVVPSWMTYRSWYVSYAFIPSNEKTWHIFMCSQLMENTLCQSTWNIAWDDLSHVSFLSYRRMRQDGILKCAYEIYAIPSYLKRCLKSLYSLRYQTIRKPNAVISNVASGRSKVGGIKGRGSILNPNNISYIIICKYFLLIICW